MEINRPISAAIPPKPSTSTPTPNRPTSPPRLAAAPSTTTAKDTATAVIPASSPALASTSAAKPPLSLDPKQLMASLQTVGLFALVSLAPAAVLMVTAFVRINIVLTLLRQALGSPQVPGNQVLTALALLLTALVMWPVGETVYHEGIEPYAAGGHRPSAGLGGGHPADQGVHGRSDRADQPPGLPLALYDYADPAQPRPAPTRPTARTSRSAWWPRRTCSAS